MQERLARSCYEQWQKPALLLSNGSTERQSRLTYFLQQQFQDLAQVLHNVLLNPVPHSDVRLETGARRWALRYAAKKTGVE